ncbi:hypothetical protein N3K63_07135 [Microbacterium sp. W1N]|uniref:hypothetical protein n=1 Tax=Microbacterium festucae TaxID=2977531 RepID=UPI0021C08F97|nr:hypothetical protein [Microbacterium festucae]MCT9820060.1 hypothetical protein [Microbacterium festucae]
MSDTDLLAPTVLRVLDAVQAPYPALLVAGEPPRLWVELDEGAPAAVWDADPAEHLLAPLDLARTALGVALVLPACPQRLGELVHRRLAIEDAEAVTIAVSVLRGCVAALARACPTGTWWVTDEGRPVLAVGGTADAVAEGAALVDALAVGRAGPLGDALTATAGALNEPAGLRRRVDVLEEALFAAADPGPLRADPVPLRARELATAALVTRADLAAQVDPGIAARVGAVVEGTMRALAQWRDARREQAARRRERGQGRQASTAGVLRGAGRMREAPPTLAVGTERAVSTAGVDAPRVGAPRGGAARGGGRKPVLVGAVVAAGIVLAGVAWPAPADERRGAPAGPSAEAEEVEQSTGATAAGGGADGHSAADPAEPPTVGADGGQDAETGEVSPPPPAAPSEGALAAGTALLAQFAACTDDACRRAHQEDPGAVLPAGPATGAGEPTVELVDEYGGVAVLRAATADATQFVVIVDVGQTWLIRDVYDAADQR